MGGGGPDAEQQLGRLGERIGKNLQRGTRIVLSIAIGGQHQAPRSDRHRDLQTAGKAIFRIAPIPRTRGSGQLVAGEAVEVAILHGRPRGNSAAKRTGEHRIALDASEVAELHTHASLEGIGGGGRDEVDRPARGVPPVERALRPA